MAKGRNVPSTWSDKLNCIHVSLSQKNPQTTNQNQKKVSEKCFGLKQGWLSAELEVLARTPSSHSISVQSRLAGFFGGRRASPGHERRRAQNPLWITPQLQCRCCEMYSWALGFAGVQRIVGGPQLCLEGPKGMHLAGFCQGMHLHGVRHFLQMRTHLSLKWNVTLLRSHRSCADVYKLTPS